MKLSQLSTDQTLDALCEITPYIGNIVIDEKLLEKLREKLDPNAQHTRAEIMAFGADKLSAIVPIVLKEHRADVYGILAALNGKTPEEVAKQNFITTGIQLRELIADKETVDFFKSCVAMAQSE